MSTTDPLKRAIAASVQDALAAEGYAAALRAALPELDSVEVQPVDWLTTMIRVRAVPGGAPRYFVVKVAGML